MTDPTPTPPVRRTAPILRRPEKPLANSRAADNPGSSLSGVALYAFVPPDSLPRSREAENNPVELRKGERVTRVEDFTAEGWVRVTREDGVKGIAPRSYLKIDDRIPSDGPKESNETENYYSESKESGVIPAQSDLKTDSKTSNPRSGVSKYAFAARPGTAEISILASERLKEIEESDAEAFLVATNQRGERGLVPRDWVDFDTDVISESEFKANEKTEKLNGHTSASNEEDDEALARRLQAELDAESSSGPRLDTATRAILRSDEELARMLQNEEMYQDRLSAEDEKLAFQIQSEDEEGYPTAMSGDLEDLERDRQIAENLQRQLSVREETVDDLKTYFADEALARELQAEILREDEAYAFRTIARERGTRRGGTVTTTTRRTSMVVPVPSGCVGGVEEIPGLVARNPLPADAGGFLSRLSNSRADEKTSEGKPTPARKRTLAILDLMQSEHTFLTSIRLLLEQIYPVFGSLIGATPDLVSDAFLYSGICDVYLLHLSLFRSLISAISAELDTGPPAEIGAQFVALRPNFAIYSRYIAAYHNLSGPLRTLASQNPGFEANLQKNRAGGGGIAELFFLPIQRVMRYGMVLSALLKTTKQLDAYFTEHPTDPKSYDPPHPDLGGLNQAISQSIALSDVVNSIQARSEKRTGAIGLAKMEGWDARELGVSVRTAGGGERLLEFEGTGAEESLGECKVWVLSDCLVLGIPAGEGRTMRRKEGWRVWRAMDVRDLTLLENGTGKVKLEFRNRTWGDARTTYPRREKPRSLVGRPPEPPLLDESRTYVFDFPERTKRMFLEAAKRVLQDAKNWTPTSGQKLVLTMRASGLDAKDYASLPGLRSSDPFVVVRLVGEWDAPVGSNTLASSQPETTGERLSLAGRSPTIPRTLNPSFPPFSVFLPNSGDSSLQLEFWDADDDEKSDFIGSFRVRLADLLEIRGGRTGTWMLVNEAERERRVGSGERYLNSGVVTVLEVRLEV